MRGFSSLAEVLQHHAVQRPDVAAVTVYSDRGERPSLTFAGLHAQAACLAEQLAAQTVPGDRALLIFPSCLEFVIAYFACLMAGVVAVPMMPPRRNAKHDASAAIMADCTPRLALSLAPDSDPRGTLRERLVEQGIRHFPVSLASEPTVAPGPLRGTTELAFLQYTSGSTSTPKGVTVSHRNLLDNLEMMRARLGNHTDSVHVSWIPLYHDLGLIMNLLQPIYLGAPCVLMTPSGFMHRPLNWLRAIHEHGAEVAAAPNFAYDLCVDRFRPEQMEGIDLSGWKIALNGAEPVRAATLARFAATFGPYGFDAHAMRPAYGLAEATLLVSAANRGAETRIREISSSGLKAARIALPAHPADISRIASCGSAMAGLSLAIVDPDTRRRLPPGQIGEIWLQAPSVACGYWGQPAESEATFRARIETDSERPPAQPDSWLRTGDLGHLDADGELYVVGRLKDVMIVRGVNHYPQDIEATVSASHPSLRRDHGAAFAILDDEGTERIVIVQEVERTQRHALSETEVASAVQAAVVNNHDIALHKIVLIQPGTLPKTTSGKIQRSLTKRRWLDGELEPWRTASQRADQPADSH
jgi:acyl-CoA synthetase (AMP-forming)/AMP-acid ligase II